MIDVRVKSVEGFRTEVTNGRHTAVADEPVEVGGSDSAMKPTELLAASLGTCTAITLQMYAQRKDWPLEGVEVRVTLDPANPKDPESVTRMRQEVALEGPLDDEQRERLHVISGRCPVHRMLDGPIEIEEVLV